MLLTLLLAICQVPPLAESPKPALTARAVVVEVTDADTVVLDATIWHDLTHRVRLRIKGLDAPELNTASGKKAHAWAKANLPVGSAVTIISGGYDKYGGRDLGDIKYDSGDLYSNAIVKFGHAKKWDGKGPKPKIANQVNGGSPDLPLLQLAPPLLTTTPVGPGITIAPVTTPAPGGGGPLRKAGRWVKKCFGTHCEVVWVEE